MWIFSGLGRFGELWLESNGKKISNLAVDISTPRRANQWQTFLIRRRELHFESIVCNVWFNSPMQTFRGFGYFRDCCFKIMDKKIRIGSKVDLCGRTFATNLKKLYGWFSRIVTDLSQFLGANLEKLYYKWWKVMLLCLW